MGISISKRIFSPRWGHDDTYTFEFDRDFLKISLLPRSATCTWRERRDPEWQGTVRDILENDSIYPPAVLESLFEHLWKEWRAGNITDAQADDELQRVIDWLNDITHNKPDSQFWQHYF